MATAIMANLTAIIALLITAAAAATTYTNHTVGGAAGWFFNSTTSTPSTNYSTWAASQTFNLGDYLIFSSNSNTTVIWTFNVTTYLNCTMDESQDNDTIQYDGGSSTFGQALTVPVPLIFEGTNYYFSDADDGFQCQRGMAFQIRVNHGLGLPPSLNQPPPPPYVTPPGPNSIQSPPSTLPQSPGNGGLVTGANVRGVFCFLLLLLLVLF